MRQTLLIGALLLIVALRVYAAPDAVHVAPWGDDVNDGTETAPFRTLASGATQTFGPYFVPPLTFEAIVFDATDGVVSPVTRFAVQ